MAKAKQRGKAMIKMFLKPIAALLFAISILLPAAPAKAGGEGLLVFYASIKIAQSQAMKAAANYYEAIGMGQQAQQFTRLAADFESGSLGGENGVKTFTQASANLENDIYELQALGVYPDARQREMAKKANQQFTVAKIALVAAIASGTLTALNGDGGMLEKIMLGAIIAAEASKVSGAMKSVSRAAKAYRNFQIGANNGFQVVSKEVQPQFVEL